MPEKDDAATSGTDEAAPSSNERQEGARTFTQEEVNALIGKTRREEREKYARFDEYKAASEQLSEVEADLKAASERAEVAERRASELEGMRQRAEWAAEVSKATGVPAAVLRGSTLEELQAHAEQIGAAMPVYPQVGSSPDGNQRQPKMTQGQILAIEDARERKAAIAANIDLFY